MNYNNSIEKIHTARAAIERSKDIAELVVLLTGFEQQLQGANAQLADKLETAEQQLQELLELKSLVAQQSAEIATLKSNSATLAGGLQSVVRQISLIEKNYNIINTINTGGKTQ